MRTKGEGSLFYDSSNDRWVGRIGSITVTSKDKATARKRWERAKAKHREGGDSSAAPTVGQLWDNLVEAKVKQDRSESTIRWYQDLAAAHLGPIAGIRADQLSVVQVEAWLEDRSHLGATTLGRLRGALAQALEVARRRRQITWNPATLAQVPKGTPRTAGEILTWEEYGRLLAAASGDRLESWLRLMLDTGLRPHESYELPWDDVDFEAMTVTARPRKAKAHKPRIVGIEPATRTSLAGHRTAQAEERLYMGDRWPRQYDALVFRSEAGTPLDGRNMNRRLSRWLEAAGIDKHLHVYDLRHTVASLAANAGVSIVELADYLGNDPATLEKHYRKPVSPVRRLGVDLAAIAASRDQTAR